MVVEMHIDFIFLRRSRDCVKDLGREDLADDLSEKQLHPLTSNLVVLLENEGL